MKGVVLSVFAFLFLTCTDSNVRTENVGGPKIYSVDNGTFFLRKVTISGDRIYFVVDKNGYPLAGTTSAQTQGKATHYVSSIVEENR